MAVQNNYPEDAIINTFAYYLFIHKKDDYKLDDNIIQYYKDFLKDIPKTWPQIKDMVDDNFIKNYTGEIIGKLESIKTREIIENVIRTKYDEINIQNSNIFTTNKDIICSDNVFVPFVNSYYIIANIESAPGVTKSTEKKRIGSIEYRSRDFFSGFKKLKPPELCYYISIKRDELPKINIFLDYKDQKSFKPLSTAAKKNKAKTIRETFPDIEYIGKAPHPVPLDSTYIFPTVRSKDNSQNITSQIESFKKYGFYKSMPSETEVESPIDEKNWYLYCTSAILFATSTNLKWGNIENTIITDLTPEKKESPQQIIEEPPIEIQDKIKKIELELKKKIPEQLDANTNLLNTILEIIS